MKEGFYGRLHQVGGVSVRVIFLVAVAITQNAQARELVPEGTAAQHVYAGVGVGATNNDASDDWDDGSVSSISTDKTDTSTKVFVGYEVTPNVAVEGSYSDFGQSEFSATSDGSGDSWAPGQVSGTNESSGFGLSAVGSWPVTDRITVFGKLGMLWWKSKNTWNESGFISVEESSGSDLSYGAGLEYDVGLPQRFVYRFEFERHEVDDSQYQLNTGSASLVYRFP